MTKEPDIYRTDEEKASIFAMAMFPLLQLNEGVIVHHEGNGFIIGKVFDDDDQEVQIKIMHDDDMLKHPDRHLVWLHDELVGNA